MQNCFLFYTELPLFKGSGGINPQLSPPLCWPQKYSTVTHLRKTWKSFSPIIVLFVIQHLCQSKVRNFGDFVFVYEDVSRRQIPVDEAASFEVFHAAADVAGQLEIIPIVQVAALLNEASQIPVLHEFGKNPNGVFGGHHACDRSYWNLNVNQCSQCFLDVSVAVSRAF